MLDRVKDRIVTIGSDRSILLLEGFDYGPDLPVVDPAAHVREAEWDGRHRYRRGRPLGAVAR